VDGTIYFTGVAAAFSPEGRIVQIVAIVFPDGQEYNAFEDNVCVLSLLSPLGICLAVAVVAL
jgi:hypothetical protein